MKKLFFLIALLFLFSSYANAKVVKLLCEPREYYIYDHNQSSGTYTKRFEPNILDLIISISEKKLTMYYDDAEDSFSRTKINADPTSFLMKFQNEKYGVVVGFLFHRKSGRLNKFKSGGQYGGDNNIFSETYYNCEKYLEPVF